MTEVVHHPSCLEPARLNQIMEKLNHQMYAWPVLLRKALLTFLQTRKMIATMFAWNSNINYRNVVKNIIR